VINPRKEVLPWEDNRVLGLFVNKAKKLESDPSVCAIVVWSELVTAADCDFEVPSSFFDSPLLIAVERDASEGIPLHKAMLKNWAVKSKNTPQDPT
jgi:hypothetical protein